MSKRGQPCLEERAEDLRALKKSRAACPKAKSPEEIAQERIDGRRKAQERRHHDDSFNLLRIRW